MNYAEIKQFDIANGAGVRTSLFVSGCRHRCPGCFNALAWEFSAGYAFSPEVENTILESLKPEYVDGLSVLGGEPLEPENQEALAPFLERVRTETPGKDIWLWTGFVWEDLLAGTTRAATPYLPRILDCCAVVVDGPFVEEEKDIMLRFRGSANQRVIDVAASREAGAVVLWKDLRIFSTHSW